MTHTHKACSYKQPMNILVIELKYISSELWPSDKNWGFLYSCLELVKNFYSLQGEVLSSYNSFPPMRLSADHDTLPSLQNNAITRNFVKMPVTVHGQRAKPSVNSKSLCIRTVEVFTLHWMNRAMGPKGQETQNKMSVWWWQKTE